MGMGPIAVLFFGQKSANGRTAMISSTATQGEGKRSELVLLDDNLRPRPLLVALEVCEIALDCLVAYGAYKAIKALKG